MYLSTRVLGSTIANRLKERGAAPVLWIGADGFTRGMLSRVECFNFLAAAILSRTLKELGVRNTSDLFHRFAPSAVIGPGVGAVTLSVLGAAFEAKQIGGDAPLESWLELHKTSVVTLDTMRRHYAAEAQAEKDSKHERAERRKRAKQAAAKRQADRLLTPSPKATAAQVRIQRLINKQSSGSLAS